MFLLSDDLEYLLGFTVQNKSPTFPTLKVNVLQHLKHFGSIINLVNQGVDLEYLDQCRINDKMNTILTQVSDFYFQNIGEHTKSTHSLHLERPFQRGTY